MRQPEPNRDSEAFLSALADELVTPLVEPVARRHVVNAAAAARAARASRRAGVIGWAAAVAVITVLGTGGIAAAGGLPPPVQAVVADLARALPVPIHVPYPVALPRDAGPTEPGEEMLRPEDGELEVEPYEPATPSRPVEIPEPLIAEDAPGIDVRDEREEGGRCDLDDLWDEADKLGEDELNELRDRIRDVCGLDFVDPPRFTDDHKGDESGDEDHEWGEAGDRDDREPDRDFGDDGDSRSSDSGNWDGDGGGDGGDGEEEQRDR